MHFRVEDKVFLREPPEIWTILSMNEGDDCIVLGNMDGMKTECPNSMIEKSLIHIDSGCNECWEWGRVPKLGK